MLGYAFMGRAHANAYRTLPYMTWPPPLIPELVAIAGRDAHAVGEAALRYGFASSVSDWRELVRDDRVQLFDNSGPNGVHAEPTIAAAEAGKHVICEKPLGRDAHESYEIWQRVAASGVKHMTGFNYRFVPAVRLAHELIAAGELGEIRHFRARYLQSWGADAELMTWRFDRAQAGSGALGDLGAHIIDHDIRGPSDAAKRTRPSLIQVEIRTSSSPDFSRRASRTCLEPSRQTRPEHSSWHVNRRVMYCRGLDRATARRSLRSNAPRPRRSSGSSALRSAVCAFAQPSSCATAAPPDVDVTNRSGWISAVRP